MAQGLVVEAIHLKQFSEKIFLAATGNSKGCIMRLHNLQN